MVFEAELDVLTTELRNIARKRGEFIEPNYWLFDEIKFGFAAILDPNLIGQPVDINKFHKITIIDEEAINGLAEQQAFQINEGMRPGLANSPRLLYTYEVGGKPEIARATEVLVLPQTRQGDSLDYRNYTRLARKDDLQDLSRILANL